MQENLGAAFLNDVISYVGQIILLLIASTTHHLDVANAFWIIAATSFTAFIVGFSKDRLLPMFKHARLVLSDGWRAGRDYLAAWQFQWLGSQGIFMIGAGVVGTEAVGGVRATQGLIGPINILFQAMENVVPIKAAKHYSASGLSGLLRFIKRITLLGSLMLVPVLLLLIVFAAPLIDTLYGKQYLAFVSLVYWQAAYIFIQFYQRQTFFFLRTVKSTGVLLRSGIIMAVFSLVVAAVTVHRFQEIGLMMALLSGTVAGLVYSLWAALKIVRTLTHNKISLDEKSAQVT